MENKKMQKLFEYAISAIKTKGILNPDDSMLDSKYTGYANSFNPAVIHSNLQRACDFYLRNETEADRAVIAEILYEILAKSEVINPGSNEKDLGKITHEIKQKSSTMEYLTWRRRVMEAAVALKLAVKMFKKSDEKRVKTEESK